MLIGWPKGQKQFLMERGLWVPGLKLQCGATAKNHTGSCCSKGIMYQQLDFQQSVSQLEELIRASGHVCLFLPRYHCELAPIERAWAFAKWYCRRYCEYTMEALRVVVPQALAMVVPEKIRQYFNNCFKICALYGSGMDLNDWLEHDRQRKNKQKRVKRFVDLVRKGEKKTEQLKNALVELERFNGVKKSSHRDFSMKIEKIISLV